MLLRGATSETYGPRVYTHHINLYHFIYLLCFYFAFILLCIFITKIPKILSYHIYQISLSSVAVLGLTTPIRVGCKDLFVLCRYEGLARSLLLD